MSHRCPAAGCTATVSDSMLLCRKDWAKVPAPLQSAVYRAYARGKGLGSEALRHAQDAAIRAVNDQLGTAKPPSPGVLWQQAGGDSERYRDLMRQHGHLLKPGDDGYQEAPASLPCGWPHRDNQRKTGT